MRNKFSFNNVPVLRRGRSRFDLSAKVLTSANVGDLIPFYVQETYPGDTFRIDSACVSRLTSSFFKPIMDNLFLDVYFFFCPSRLVFDDFPAVFGENTKSAWAEVVPTKVPMTRGLAGDKVVSGSVADYMGLPVGMDRNSVSVLPFRAFAKIYDDWFRDQNVISPMHIITGNTGENESFNGSSWSPSNYFGMPPKVAKMHDYFTSCLPAPQKGTVVDVPVLSADNLPVRTYKDPLFPKDDTAPYPLMFRDTAYESTPLPANSPFGAGLRHINEPNDSIYDTVALPTDTYSGTDDRQHSMIPVNLAVDLTRTDAGFANVNDLRMAFALQKMLERDARSGTRYVEYLASHWGVQSGDARLQRTEFLGGQRTPISVTQVSQTAPSTSTDKTPLATVAGYSASASRARAVKGFVEHGYVIGVFCIRQFHSYHQGVQRFWTRSARTDFYEPVFANIGEQPVMATELMYDADKDRVFGYNEAWADLRYRPNLITGQMRPGLTNSLAMWHLGDNYATVPTLGKDFVEETPMYLDRAITVNSSKQNQFILDFYVSNIAYRELPTYSVPSLIDHN